jgi:hypothetical protein
VKTAEERYCAICLEPRVESDGWFLLAENRWTDRLKILAWNDTLATEPGVYAACGAEHVRQLVIHWMAVGSLDYPFARVDTGCKRSTRKSAAMTEPCVTEPDTKGIKVFGELAVHRESLERVLTENPQCLASILMALISALGGPSTSIAAEEREDEAAYALT